MINCFICALDKAKGMTKFMKICQRGLNFIQVIDYRGTVRLCCWINNNEIGNLSNQSLKEIYHGEQAEKIRRKLSNGDYSDCNVDACPYLAMGDMDNHMVEISEVSEYPEELYLAYEEVCNYSCTSCTIHRTMMENKTKDLENGYDKIEKELREVLPYIKTISANGRVELFASKRILKLLSNWKPLAPAEEISVYLETNGSMFDEKHWQQISNLGQYHLSVAITVMSFDERTYQILSGTKLPISQIESNLLFVKGLREKGIVNYFEIATVVQERNFRRLPEFTRRCVEEFGADYVRLSPYKPWGSREPEVEWFMDVRNPRHPYYEEYQDVMKAPIFRHPLVHDWSGGKPSNTGDFPYRISERKLEIVTSIFLEDVFRNKIKDYLEKRNLVVYGLGEIGKILVKQFQQSVLYVIDRNMHNCNYLNKKIYSLEELEDISKEVCVVVTPLLCPENIRKYLLDVGYKTILLINELVQ